MATSTTTNTRATGPPQRPSTSFTDIRSTPMVDSFLSILPSGHEKALKYAFYNVLALVSSAFVILTCWTVYCILEPFIKPLLWAVLCGTVLYPFKSNLSNFARSWLKNVRNSPTPFTLQVAAVPFKIIDSTSDSIGGWVWNNWKSILGGFGGFIATYALYYHPPLSLVYLAQAILSIIFGILGWTLGWINWPMIISLNTVYVGYIVHFVAIRQSTRSIPSPRSSPRTPVLSQVQETEDETDKHRTSDAGDSSEVVSSTTSGTPWLVRDQLKTLTALSYTTAIVTITFICLRLPYTILVPMIIITGFGAVTYFTGQSEDNKNGKPPFSKVAKTLIIWSSKITGTPIAMTGEGDGGRSRKSSLPERFNLQRSWSDGAGRFRGSPITKPNLETSKSLEKDTVEENDDIADGDGSSFLDSNNFLYFVLCAIIFVQVWNRLWLLHLLPIPVVYYGLKKFALKFGFGDYVRKTVKEPLTAFYADVQDENSQRLFPLPLRILFNIISAGDRKLISICEDYLDPAISAVVLILVVMCTVLGIIFSLTQVYGEGDHLVRVGVNLVNSTVSQYPEINDLLPEGWQSIMDSMAQNAYVYGKEYITNIIRDTVAEKNPVKAEQIEIQVIEIWDRIYLAWNQTWDAADGSNLKLKPDGLSSIEWNELLEQGKAMPDLLDISATYAKANVGTIWTILESLYNLFIGNVSLVLSTITAILSVLFGSGTAILNLMLNLVVFFTSLFYLLSLSTKEYKPKELLNLWTPGNRHSMNFAAAVEEAVNGVFTASFKMAAFYGMWTWLTHTLFQVNIVFLPSIFAALFGAVPFITHYFAALPAVLELWLIQGHWPKAVLMLLVQMAPMSVVDTQIYSEIKGGGHPYLTGLAVAGGIFYFGFQGAIMGPIVLCCFFVAFKVGGSFLRDEEPDTNKASFTQRLNSSETN